MDLQTFGKIIDDPIIREGVSNKGNEWKCATYVIETDGRYPKKIAFDVFSNENIEKFGLKKDEYVNVFFDIDAREYNNRWFNTIRAWKVERPGEEEKSNDDVGKNQQPQPQPSLEQSPQNDALPF